MYKFPPSFDPSTYLTIRRARICYFEATNRILKEKRQGSKVRVRRISDESVRWEGYGRVVDEA